MEHQSIVTMSPVVLSHVCTRWKTILIECPRFWSSIDLQSLSLSTATNPILQMFLTKSARCPLDFRVSAWDRDLPEQGENPWQFLTRYFFQSERLSFHINHVNLQALLAAFRDLDVGFRDLSFFRLLTQSMTNEHPLLTEKNPFWEGLCQAPKLAEVHVSEVYPRTLLPYSQLTSLVFHFVSHTDLPELLGILETSKLCSLTLKSIQLYTRRPLDIIAPRRVKMDSLRTLVINDAPIDGEVLEVLFGSLVLPSLLTFELVCRDSWRNQNQDVAWPSPLLNMLQHSSVALQHIRLCLDPIYREVIWPPLMVLFRMTPHLTHFSLSGCEILSRGESRIPLHYLSSSLSDLEYSEGNTLLPELEALSFTGIEMTGAILNKALNLARSRSCTRLHTVTNVHPLKEIHIVYVTSQSSPAFVTEPHISKMIESLERDGVKIVIEEEISARKSRFSGL
ncbi:hypothetical protein L218DRAFT_583855 [Marasmius fiardii PR-910]|nr:hypothetical protein L218DRAFT_583855 [Marasmius fiardii PR-910]